MPSEDSVEQTVEEYVRDKEERKRAEEEERKEMEKEKQLYEKEDEVLRRRKYIYQFKQFLLSKQDKHDKESELRRLQQLDEDTQQIQKWVRSDSDDKVMYEFFFSQIDKVYPIILITSSSGPQGTRPPPADQDLPRRKPPRR